MQRAYVKSGKTAAVMSCLCHQFMQLLSLLVPCPTYPLVVYIKTAGVLT